MAEDAPKRQACHGSCHCGLTRYIVYLTLPHRPSKSSEQEIYRCNCSTCYKMNFFHVHPANPRDDFMLLSPLDPDHELSIYQCNEKLRKYFFCPKCGVRCLTFSGESEIIEGTWRAKWDGKDETRPYLSVNGTTIEPREDLDFRVLTEEKRVQYFDGRSDPKDEKEPRWDRPHDQGCY